jgi:hypothetical protein
LRKGFIEDTGEKRKARSGRSQRVMKITKKWHQFQNQGNYTHLRFATNVMKTNHQKAA